MKLSDTSERNEIPFLALVAFEATARLGSMSAAAGELNLTQSAISQRVLKLEAHAGQRLFVRQGHGVKMTGAGVLLMQTASEILEKLQVGFDRIEPYRNKDSLLLACPFDFSHGWLMPRMNELRASHGGLEIWLMPEDEVNAIDRIDVDLVISRKPLYGPDIECLALLEDQAIAVCGPRTAEGIVNIPFPRVLGKAPLLFLESSPEWGGALSSVTKQMRKRRAATIDDERLLLDAVEHEMGIAYLSKVFVASSLNLGRVVQLPQVPTSPKPHFWLMRSRLTPRTPVANRAFDWLQLQAAIKP